MKIRYALDAAGQYAMMMLCKPVQPCGGKEGFKWKPLGQLIFHET